MFNHLCTSAAQVIKGKDEIIKLSFTTFFSGGHILIEDLPGVGKTTLAKTLSKLLGLTFNRIQMTNDLLPTDVLGYKIYNSKEQEFNFERGPIFTDILLADELNRASPKTQSALLEAMEEKVVSIEGNSYRLSDNFFVIATQNPYGQIGTFPLPESQLDRFSMKISIGTPSQEIEAQLLMQKNPVELLQGLDQVISPDQIISIKSEIEKVHISEPLSKYIVELLNKSRIGDQFQPLSPRSGLDLVKLVKSKAYFDGRDYCHSDDVIEYSQHCWGHRLNSINQGAIEKGHKVVSELLSQIKAP